MDFQRQLGGRSPPRPAPQLCVCRASGESLRTGAGAGGCEGKGSGIRQVIRREERDSVGARWVVGGWELSQETQSASPAGSLKANLFGNARAGALPRVSGQCISEFCQGGQRRCFLSALILLRTHWNGEHYYSSEISTAGLPERGSMVQEILLLKTAQGEELIFTMSDLGVVLLPRLVWSWHWCECLWPADFHNELHYPPFNHSIPYPLP